MAPSKLRPRKHATQARGKETVAAILEAAAQVFVARGYAHATTNHIAERAGVSVGSVYQYFPNKDAILVALVRQHLAQGGEVLEALWRRATDSSGPLESLLRGFVEAMVELHTAEPKLHRVLFEEAPHPREVRDHLKQVEEESAVRIAALLRAHPEVRVDDEDIAAYFAVHAVESLTHHLVLHAPAALTRARFIDELVGMLHRYLTPTSDD